MKKIISILVCISMVLAFMPAVFVGAEDGNIYYVSPDGSDHNSGTQDSPWKTFSYAASTAQAGDTVIFKDGTYNESALAIFTNSGTESAPIVFKSENKHGAIIKYNEDNSNANVKVQINSGKEYIEIRDFVFTQKTPSESNTSDIMVRVRNSANCKIIGNKIENVYEEGIKLSNAQNILIENNVIKEAGHEGIDAVNAADCIIRKNEILDCGRTGVMIKGNSRNMLVYNNLIKNDTVVMENGGYAFTVGGATGIVDGTTLVDYETGYEAYNCVFYNNIICGGDDKNIKTGFGYIGAKDCYCYNNTIVGVTNGFSFGNNGGIANGWGWNAGNTNPVIKNNIVSDAARAFDITEEPENLVSDYNLYNNITNAESIPVEENSVEGNPKFKDAAADWSIPTSSPAAKAGCELPAEVAGFPGYESIEGVTADKKLPIEKIDFYGKTRKTPNDIGACNREKVKTVELLYEDFETGTIGNDVVGWNGWVNKNTSKPNDSYFKIAKESSTSENKVGNITRTNSNSNSVQFVPAKSIKTGTSAGENVSVKFKLRTDDSRTRAVAVSVFDSNSKNVGMTLYMNDSSNAGRVFFGSGNKYIQGTNKPLTVGKWYEFEYLIHFGEGGTKGTLIVDGKELLTNQALSIKDVSFIRLESSRNMGTTSTDHDGKTVVADVKIDDIVITSIGDMEVVSMKPTEDGNLATALIEFSNEVDKTTLAPEDISINDGDITVTKAELLETNKKMCLVTFESPLEFETEYNVSVKGIADSYGKLMEDTKLVYRTRDRKFNVGTLAFYSEYDTENETVMEKLSDGVITAAFDVVNEKEDPYEAALILLHKRDGNLIAATAADATVAGEDTDDKYVSLKVEGVTETDSLEVYLWNSLQGMKPVAEGKIMTPQSVETISYGEDNVISSLDVQALMSDTSKDSAKIKITGTVSPEVPGAVTAYVLKPGYKISDITFDNFNDVVDFAGQNTANEQGVYTFGYTMKGAVNGKSYNVYTGGNSVGKVKDTSVIFFTEEFIETVISALNKADADTISKMLAGDITVPDVTPEVYLNTVLNLDLTEYSKLNDYTAYESYKSAVSKELEKLELTDTETIRSAFGSIVAVQKAAQEKYIWLLNEINKSLWSNLAQKFQENDTENNKLLHLNWEGSYSKIKSDKDLLESFYKKLESIPFNNFDDIRKSFEDEAFLLIPPEGTESGSSGSNSSGGGGGGGGSVKYSPDLAQKNTAEPLEEKTENTDEGTKKTVTFDDIDSVPWAQEAIKFLAENEIVNGVAKGKFAPNDFVTREQFVKMVILAMGLYDETAITEQFVDADKRAWYNSYIANAVEHGIVHGMDNTHFGIGLEITRAEMAAIICRAAEAAGKKLPTGENFSEYADKENIPDYAESYVAALGEAGIMNGVGNGLFAPRDKATRAMAAKVIYLLMGVN